MAGKTGVLAVALVDYAGFEPVQRLITGGVVDGVPIDTVAGRRAHAVAGGGYQSNGRQG